eukprot:CAMPEP_0197593026 /NCGR_PEP_ID=MMETSP1326-20131121/16934_1 /TAXON_ID=1155430 /ORGANISM="Genus nov. species nov., Strain RCC2288" /LENGTH=67 /DNA_ID=CAMNT_0043158887 /DNA_START=95 /DNA_END=299 /DNA_ORIENTATION=+
MIRRLRLLRSRTPALRREGRERGAERTSAAAARSGAASVLTVTPATHPAGLTTASTRNSPRPSAAAA